MRAIRSLILIGLATTSLAACADPSTADGGVAAAKPPTVTASLGPDDLSTPDTTPFDPGVTCGPGREWESVPALVGLKMKKATAQAEEQGYEVRIAGEDGECRSHTDDLLLKRVNIYSEDDRVVWAMLY